jgi:hypothetical protein
VNTHSLSRGSDRKHSATGSSNATVRRESCFGVLSLPALTLHCRLIRMVSRAKIDVVPLQRVEFAR